MKLEKNSITRKDNIIMRINIHAGHNKDGNVACGAIGLIKESTEARNVKNEIINILRNKGHKVFDCTVDDAVSQSDNLSKIVSKCNSNVVDLDVSIHFNAGVSDMEGNNKTTGCEVFIYDENSGAKEYAENICKNISSLGFRNRGVKTNNQLYVLKNTKAPALLVECCFVDDKDDVELYDYESMAKAIANGIVEKYSEETENVDQTEDKDEFNPYLCTIKVRALNVRKGPGVDYPIVQTLVNDKNKYTIVEETDGKGATKWCKLKSGIGWISKDFIKK